MAREFAISVYLFIFRILFNQFKRYPQKKKTVAVASFGDNIFYTMDAIKSISDEELIILKTPSCRFKFDTKTTHVIPFEIKHPIAYLKSIYHLATATSLLVDNYYGFLASTKFRPRTTCVQLWHAAGAIKRFGLEDPTNEGRSDRAMERFKKVYNNFDYTVVGSEKMAAVFRKSFGLTNERILRTGIPRTDAFFNKTVKQEIYRKLKQAYPTIEGKKILLYAPTFRNQQLSNYQLQLDLAKLSKELSDEYILFIKPHPAVNFVSESNLENFIIDVSHFRQVNDLLLVTDILITDYSSIPFEFALLEKPMIFFAYDLEEYKEQSGLMEDYVEQMPGPVVRTTEEIVEAIKGNDFNLDEVREFAKEWNEYSDGRASLRLARALSESDNKEKEKAYI